MRIQTIDQLQKKKKTKNLYIFLEPYMLVTSQPQLLKVEFQFLTTRKLKNSKETNIALHVNLITLDN